MILEGDCIERMAELPEASVDAIVCDPPYGLGFMGKEWDNAERLASVPPSGTPDTPLGRFNTGKGPQAVAFDGLAFQGWSQIWATAALRVLKPGGHLLAFGGTRTYHRLACAVEDAGFEIRDSLIYLYGSGFPKSLNLDRLRGESFCGCGTPTADGAAGGATADSGGSGPSPRPRPTQQQPGEPGTLADERGAQNGRGWPGCPRCGLPIVPRGLGTALKPSHEPIVVARKPLIGTVARNVQEHGTGALNVDGCRVEHDGSGSTRNDAGRWPPNVILSHLPECEQVGTRKVKGATSNSATGESIWASGGDGVPRQPGYANNADGTETIPAYACVPGCPVAELDRQSGKRPAGHEKPPMDDLGYGDTGGASRFFYCAKASRSERNAGLGGFEEQERRAYSGPVTSDPRMDHEQARNPAANNHPTVKPIALMRWLVRLVTPPSGTVLDPFLGSGTTGAAAALEGFDFIGIEREAEYAAIARARVEFWAQFPGADVDAVLESDARARDIEASGQLGLLG